MPQACWSALVPVQGTGRLEFRSVDTIAGLAKHATVSDARPDNVGTQPAYAVTVSPAHDGGLLGSGQLSGEDFMKQVQASLGS